MANIPLQSIKFPDLPNIYDAPTMEGIGKGIFPELIAGGLVDLDSYVENSNPYLFATMPQGTGKVLTDELVGAKVAWNQLCGNESKSQSDNGITVAFDKTTGKTTVTVSSNATGYCQLTYNPAPQALNGHKVLMMSNKALEVGMEFYATRTQEGVKGNYSSPKNKANIVVSNGTGELNNVMLYVPQTVTAGTYEYYLQYIDLTAELGSTIADHIYSLEQGTAGAGVAFFTKYFGSGYRPYDAGSLQGALVSGHKTVGVNQWDEEWEGGTITSSTGANASDANKVRSKNYIPIISGATYYVKAPSNVTAFYYDENKAFTVYAPIAKDVTFTPPTGTRYMRFAMGSSGSPVTSITQGTFCINISNADINGKHYPYEEHTYDIEPEDLNGMFKLVDGELKADGDIRRADGSTQRKYGIVDLGSLDWEYNGVRFKSSFIPLLTQKVSRDKGICSCYQTFIGSVTDAPDESLIFGEGIDVSVYVKDSRYTDTTTFKQAVNGKGLVYELATPTEGTAEPFEEYQRCNPYGTQQFILDESQVAPIPAGHNTKYFEDPLANIMARLDALENA